MDSTNNTNINIMIIDNDVNMMDILAAVLKNYGHNVSTFIEPVTAIEELKKKNYDILIVNYIMTPVNGERIVELIREFNKEIYIILMSTHKDLSPSIDIMQKLDIQSYFEKSSRFDQLILLIQTGIKYTEQLKQIKSMNMKLDNCLVEFAQILLNTIDAKDHYTAQHSSRVKKFAELFANYLNMDEESLEILKTAALFHDVGKIGTPDSILLKNGKLTDDEYSTIKLHPLIGANILRKTNIYDGVPEIIESHHERIDGKGYPNAKKGEDIPYLAKILVICDSFDAITSKRSYKDEESIEFAISELKGGLNTQFDSDLAIKFINLIKDQPEQIKEIINNK